MKNFFPLLLLAVSIQSIAAPINNMDCSDAEVAGYLDQSKYQKDRGFNTIPNYDEYKAPHMNREKLEKGDAAGDTCSTIFDEGIDTSGGKAVWDKVSGILSDPIGTLSEISQKSNKRIEDVYDDMSGQMKKGVCERLGKKSVGNATGDVLDKVYKESTKDSVLSGTKTNMDKVLTGGGINGGSTIDPSDAIGKNFTYSIIKNQLGKNGSTIAKLLDLDNPNGGKGVIKAGSGAVDGALDSLENAIFGR